MSAARVFLVDLLDGATIDAPGSQYVEPRQIEVAHDSRSALFQHPPSTVRLALPAWASTGELVTAAGIARSVWERMLAAVDFEIGTAAEPGGPVTWLHAVRVDARAADGRRWHPLRVRCHGAAELVLRTSSEDSTFAWVGWAEPFVEAAGPAPAPRRWPERIGGRRLHHVLLVTADALRVDHSFGDAVHTPAIDALVAAGACPIVARAPGTTTPGNYASLLTGRLPHRHGVTDEWQALGGHVPNLASELARAGYRTVFAASERELMERRSGFAGPFEHVVPCKANPCQNGEVTTRALLSAVDALPAVDTPLLIWAQYFDAHPPVAYPAALVRPYYDLDPRDPANSHDPDELACIHGAEVVLELVSALDGLRAGLIDGRVPYRLRATAAVLAGRAPTGPDLASHLRALGPEAMLGRDTFGFARWLAAQAQALEAGVASPALLDWFDGVLPLLRGIERDALSWLDGVCDSRYPRAVLKAGCAHVDAQLGALVDGLEARGMLETTTVVFCSPHGELLGEGGYYYQHHPPLEPVLRTPLLLMAARTAHEGFTAPATTMELVDVVPTLLSLLGLDPPRGLDGRDRLLELSGAAAALAPRPIVSIGHAGQHVVVSSQTHKLVRQRLAGFAGDGSFIAAGTDRWFDIGDGDDVACEPPSGAGRLIATADEVGAALGAAALASPRGSVPEARLRPS